METKPTRTGFATSEFWLSIVSQLVALAVLFGVLPDTEAGTVSGLANEVVLAAAALISAAVVAYKYVEGRAKIKAAALGAKDVG